ncbi:MAG: AMP-binding protein [Deltaproteobacteria bacterium]|nr:AMP-binding protein [Deltaproteobacteria bacterium]
MPEAGLLREALANPSASEEECFPKLLLDHASRRGNRIAMREKDLGIWQSWTWAQTLEEVRAFALGLADRGFRPGDKLAIIGDNRPRLYWAMVAAQALGGVPVPLYQDSVAEEMRYVLEHAEARFAVAEDQEQVDKLFEIREHCPVLVEIYYDDPRGLLSNPRYDQPWLVSYEEVQAEGHAFHRERPTFFVESVARVRADDPAVIVYTSGTTGRPKGVVLTFSNLLSVARSGARREGLTEREEVLAYLPMAWIGDHIFSFAQSYATGFCVNCPESSATVLTDLRELGPTYFFAPPRIYESILTTVMIRMEDASAPKRKIFHFFMGVARRAGTRILDGKPVSWMDRFLYGLGRFLVYEPLKNVLGFSRIRLAYTAGEAIGPEIFEFYRSLGMNVKQLYGMTEAAVFVCIQPDGQVKTDTVGTPMEEVEVRVGENGEVLVRSPGIFSHYFKNPEATAQAKDADGWFHTGDAGFFDADGHLKIIDRAQDVGRLQDGSLFAPKYLENKLKFFPHVKEAVAFGHGKEYVAAFINIDLGAVGSWAERRNLPYTGYTDLAGKPEVYELVKGCVEQVNRDLAGEAHLSSSQIRRFLILHKELDADDGELTRTRKVRRGFIAERYSQLIGALYSDCSSCRVEAQVTFEDGRKGVIKADLAIAEAETFAPAGREP